MWISVPARLYRCVLKVNSLERCVAATKNVAQAVAPLHSHLLAGLGSYSSQFVEPLGDPLHSLLVLGGLAGGREAIPAPKLSLIGLTSQRGAISGVTPPSFHRKQLNFQSDTAT